MRAPRKGWNAADRSRAYRERLRSQGLRPIQIWVPDTRAASFVEQAHLQSVAVGSSDHAVDDQDFIDRLGTKT